jgi:enoyl-CoA hydratase/carnithine racemase
MAEFVNVQVTDGAATILLDRPPMNAISVLVQDAPRQAAATITMDPEVRARGYLRWREDLRRGRRR